MRVIYLSHMGDDLTVINAARASFDKRELSKGAIQGNDFRLLQYLARGYTSAEWDTLASTLAKETDIKVIQDKLWEAKTKQTHFAPFTHPQVSFHIEAPLAISRQLWRSHVGATGGDTGYAGWSEESRRYIDSAPSVHIPNNWRKRAHNIKQGSSDEPLLEGEDDSATALYNTLVEQSAKVYAELIKAGVAPEQARYSLLNSTNTSWTWTGSLMFFARMCWLRNEAHAQAEASVIAKQIDTKMQELFPYSWAALMNTPVDRSTIR